MTAALPVSIADIRAAAGRIRGAVEHTPCLHSRTLSQLTGAEIFLTSVQDGEGRARELGAVEYLLKPVRLEALLAAVNRHLKGPR